MGEYDDWNESKGRISDRFDRIEDSLKTIRDNSSKLIWLGVSALATLVGHAVMSFIQMSAK